MDQSDEQLLVGLPLSADYEPPSLTSWSAYAYDPNRPIFTPMAVNAMLQDPRVRLGLAMRTGPIAANSRFYVDSDRPDVKEFVAKQINRFWRNSIYIAVSNHEYGWQPAEVIYRKSNGELQFDRLRHIHPHDANPVILHGMLVGMEVNCLAVSSRQPSATDRQNSHGNIYIGAPKVFWSVCDRRRNRWFGDPVLRGAFYPWYEKWANRGYKDQRQLFYYKYSFQGPTLYVPKGSQPPDTSGTGPFPNSTKPRANLQLGQKIVDAYASGAGICLERSWSATGQPDWELVPPGVSPPPLGLLQYGHDLDDEILEGMCIPPEMARSGGGSGGQGGVTIGGQGGRDIPRQAFYAILQQSVLEVITDFDEQVIQFLVRHRFGEVEYDIECFGLLRNDNAENPDMATESSQDSLLAGSEGDQNQLQNQPQTMSHGVCYRSLSETQRERLSQQSAYTFKLSRSA